MTKTNLLKAACGAIALLASGCALFDGSSGAGSRASGSNPRSIHYRSYPQTAVDTYGKVIERGRAGNFFKMFADEEGECEVCEMEASAWMPIEWVNVDSGSAEESARIEFDKMLSDGKIHRFSGFEVVSVADLGACRHKGLKVGELVPLDIRHKFVIDPPFVLRDAIREHGSLQSEYFANRGKFQPEVSDCYGRVVRIDARVVGAIPTDPATFVVEVAGVEQKRIECLVAKKESDPNDEMRRVEGIFQSGARLTLVGYEIPYGYFVQPWGTAFQPYNNAPERRQGKSVFLVCEVE